MYFQMIFDPAKFSDDASAASRLVDLLRERKLKADWSTLRFERDAYFSGDERKGLRTLSVWRIARVDLKPRP